MLRLDAGPVEQVKDNGTQLTRGRRVVTRFAVARRVNSALGAPQASQIEVQEMCATVRRGRKRWNGPVAGPGVGLSAEEDNISGGDGQAYLRPCLQPAYRGRERHVWLDRTRLTLKAGLEEIVEKARPLRAAELVANPDGPRGDKCPARAHETPARPSPPPAKAPTCRAE